MNIDELIDRYWTRSFGYYFWRTSWPVPIASTLALVGTCLANTWWLWILMVVLAFSFARLVQASHGAWEAMRKAGVVRELIRLSGTVREP